MNIIDSKLYQHCEPNWHPRIDNVEGQGNMDNLYAIEYYLVLKKSAQEIVGALKDVSAIQNLAGCFFLCGCTGHVFMFSQKEQNVPSSISNTVKVTYDSRTGCKNKKYCLDFACPLCVTTSESFCGFWNRHDLGKPLFISDLPANFGKHPLPLNQMLDFNKLWADVPPRDGTAVDGHVIEKLWGDKA